MPETDKPKPNGKDIRANATKEVMWDPDQPMKSLRDVRLAAEEEGEKAIAWYWNKKPKKQRSSQFVQFVALVLTAAAGIVPLIIQIWKSGVYGKVPPYLLDSGPIATLLIGFAAALLGLDKAFGFSTGWTRYVLTATSMTRLLHEFRMDWVAMVAEAGNTPTPAQLAALIQRAKDFVSSIQAMVLQETKDWATEFQSNLAQMEKDLKAQLDQLKAQVEKGAKEKEAAAKPGAVELTVTNADKTDAFQYDVLLEGQTSKVTEPVPNNKVWTRINVTPGQYNITVTGKAQGKPAAISAVVEVKPGETAKPQVTLPIA